MIVENVTRDRHHKDLHHPLRYADLEGLLEDPGAKARLHLSVHFTGSVLESVPEHRQSKRAGRQKAGLPHQAAYFQVLQLHHHPDAARVVEAAGRPWADEQQPRVVFAQIHPLERKVTEWFPALRGAMVDAIRDRVASEMAQGPSVRWMIHVALLPESAEFEIGTTTWSELLRNDEIIVRQPLP